jgi:hypothetical protein
LIFREFPAVFGGFHLISANPSRAPRRGRSGCRVLAFGHFSEPCGEAGWARTGQPKPCRNFRKCLIFRGFSAFSAFLPIASNPCPRAEARRRPANEDPLRGGVALPISSAWMSVHRWRLNTMKFPGKATPGRSYQQSSLSDRFPGILLMQKI